MADRHMGVAEVKRHFADVVDGVVHRKQRVIVERRGRPVAAIVPLDEVDTRTPGQRLASLAGTGGPEAAEFADFMVDVLRERRSRMPRPVPEISE